MNNNITNTNLQLLLKYRQYAVYTKTIQQILILKQEGYPLNRNSSLNRGMKKIETLQDKIIEEKIQENLHGNITPTNHTQTTDKIIEDTLTHQRKSLIRKDIGNADKITRGNIEQYQKILDNRLEKEKRKLDNRIEDEIQKAQKQRLNHKETEQQIRKTLNENKPRIKHILRDATHTNQAGLSLAGALEQGYNYKIWNNGRSRTRVRPWHRARKIQAVEIDDVFEIPSDKIAYMMYPGDLNGGAENVANCRCWLSYTNEKPNNLKEYTSVSIGSTYKPSVTKPFGGLNITSRTKPVTEAIQSVVSTGKKATKKIRKPVEKIVNPIRNKLQKIPRKIIQKIPFKNKGLSDFLKTDYDKIKIDNTGHTKEYNNFINYFKGIIPKKLLKVTSNILSEFKEKTKGLDFEIAMFYGWDMELKYFLSDNKKRKVGIPKEVIKYGKNKGYYLVTHNHPTGVGLPSVEDMENIVKINSYIFEIIPRYGKGSMVINSNMELVKQSKKEILKEHKDWIEYIKNHTYNDDVYKKEFEELDKKYPKNRFGERPEGYREKEDEIYGRYVVDNHIELTKKLNKRLSKYGLNIYYHP